MRIAMQEKVQEQVHVFRFIQKEMLLCVFAITPCVCCCCRYDSLLLSSNG